MNNDKVNEVLRKYIKRLEASGWRAERWPADVLLPHHSHVPALQHCRWMCEESLNWPVEKLEKKMRWLGFIQGVFFTTNFMAINEMKYDNKPKPNYNVDSLCNMCMVPEHDTCANNPNCPCCCDTMSRSMKGSG